MKEKCPQLSTQDNNLNISYDSSLNKCETMKANNNNNNNSNNNKSNKTTKTSTSTSANKNTTTAATANELITNATTATATTTTTTKTTVIPANAQNERLQRAVISDKLDTFRQQQQQQQKHKQRPKQQQHQQQHQQQQQQQQQQKPFNTTPQYCNGVGVAARFVNCCHDVNCRLNAATLILQQQQQQQQQHQHQQQMTNRRNSNDTHAYYSNNAAAAAASADANANAEQHCTEDKQQRRSGSRATSVNSNASRYSTNTNATTTSTKSTATLGRRYCATREHSNDSGVSSDSITAAAAAAAAATASGIKTTAASTASLWPNANNNTLWHDAQLTLQVQLDIFSWLLLFLSGATRLYKLSQPPHVVFDELHYGKYITFYARNIFFFDQHPPLGKQLIAAVASFAGYDGNFTFPHIGAEYTPNVPIFWLRLVPALCGTLLAPAVYKLLLLVVMKRWIALLGGLLIVFDNALLTQSRFILMEPILLLFTTCALYCLLQFQRTRFGTLTWLTFGLAAAALFACATSVKYVGFFSACLAAYLMCRHLWQLLYDTHITDVQILLQTGSRLLLFTVVPLTIYLAVFYVHLQALHRAGPHDSAMTSAFQASLDGGLASITRSQPLNVAHGSQITLRHTHGRTCWLHSHAQVYPVRYPDKRGSSHQQQVTCYAFKDVNNWWIVKRPDREDLIIDSEPDVIRDGDIIQLVHGITSRALNSHDVAAPMTPNCQEVSCYIDYEIKMAGELLWRVQIINKDTEGPIWHAIRSEVRLIHESTGAALRYSGKLLPDWGFNQNEVVADRVVDQIDTIWNVEEHRYTKTQDKRERERQLINEEMIPTQQTTLTFWEKFIELQSKMLWHSKHLQSHMYSSEPLEWPLLDKGIAYWVNGKTNAQIHLLGNVLIWYSGTLAVVIYAGFVVFYLVRRRRLCYDLPPLEWQRFRTAGDIFFVGYLFHYVPYFFMDRTLFLHHYLPALLFKLLLLCFVVEHIDYLLRRYSTGHVQRPWLVRSYRLGVLLWFSCVIAVFIRFLPLSYGFSEMSAQDITSLRWKDTWDFILQKSVIRTP